MSYDLFFRPRHGILEAQQFAAYFARRKHYELNGKQAWYENEDTGVGFSFDLEDPLDESDDDPFPIAMNINFFRPSYFILEAEPEVTTLCVILIWSSWTRR